MSERKPLSPEDVARLNAKYKNLGAAMAASLNYKVALEAAGEDPSKWTADQAAEFARLRAQLEAANSTPAPGGP